MKDYFLSVLEKAAPENGELQDAIEFAYVENRILMTGDLATDLAAIQEKENEILNAYRNARYSTTELVAGVPITEQYAF